MKKAVQLLALLCLSFQTFGQVPENIPASIYPNSALGPVSMTQISAKFDSLIANPDTLLNHEKIKAQRWMKYVLSKYNIENDTVFNNKPYNDALKAFYQGNNLCGNDVHSNWTPDGPLTPNFSPGLGNIQPFRGWLDAVSVNSTDPDKIVVATRTSGFFRTQNGGQNWVCVTDNLPFPVLGCRTMISLPSQPNRIVAISGNNGIDGGVLYSDDFGLTWSTPTQILPTFHWLDYHPTNPDLLFACSIDELYYSFDKGVSWTSAGSPSDIDYPNDNIEMFEVFVRDNSVALVSKPEHNGSLAFIHNFNYSLTGNTLSSTSWTNKLNSDFELTTTDEINFIDFSNKVGNTHYIQVKSNQGSTTYKTIDGGANYTPVTNVIIPIAGWLKNEIIVSENNPDVVYWGSVSIYPFNTPNNDPQAKRYNTISGSSTFIQQHASNPGHHDDYRSSHIVSVAGKDLVAIGHDGGLGIIYDGLAISPIIESANGDLNNNLLHTFDIHERTGTTVFAYQDGPMFYRLQNGAFSSNFLWEGSAAMVQKQYPDAFVGEDSYSGIEDKLGSPHEIVNGTLGQGGCLLGGPFITYHHFPNRFARGLAGGMIAMNRGVNLSTFHVIDFGYNVNAVAICARKPQTLYASRQYTGDGYWDFRLYKSTNDGYNWSPIQDATVEINGSTIPLWNALGWTYIKSLAVHPDNEDVVYASVAKTRVNSGQFVEEEFRVIKSTNGGDHFEDYSEGLPALPVDELLTVESDNDLIFCATAVGIFYRTNTMTQWECFSNNLPKVEITALKYDYCNNMLYASTYGRGLWKTQVGFDVPNTYQEEITANTTWSTDRVQCDNVLVKAGKTLTITAKVEFYRNKKVIVEPGAKLYLAGGHLTSYCNDYWQGIEVHGDFSLPQNSLNQGKVVVTDGTIENAREAIMPWKYGDWTKTGGIIQATRATFRNNKRSIQYMGYHNIHPVSGAELNNLGYFADCTFEWTDDFFEAQPRPAITMNGVKGVKIAGCTFQDLRTNISDVANRGRGIFTIDAGYSVKGRSLLLNPPTHDYYDATNYDVCEFINLYKGVENLSGTSAYPFLADHSSFLNCQEGITVNGVDNAMLSRNHFNHDGNCPSDIQYGSNLNLYSASAYNVQGNVFENDLGIPNYGVVTIDNGPSENQIRKNKFDNQYTANGAFGSNANDIFFDENLAKGLQFLCNENTANKNDMLVFSWPSPNQGVRLFQGAPGQATLNELSQNLQSGGFHFSTTDQQNLKYYWNGAAGNPTQISGNLSTVLGGIEETCPSDFDGGIVMLHEGGILAEGAYNSLSTELVDLKTEFDNLNDVFTNSLLAGDATGLHNAVAGLTINNRLTVKQDLLVESPYLSLGLLTKLSNVSSNIFPHEWLQDVIEANVELTLNNNFRNHLTTKTQPLPTAIYDSIMNYARDNNTQRGLDMAGIGVVTTRIAEIENLLLADLSHSEKLADQNNIPVSILNRNNYMKRAEMIDHYLSKGDVSEAQNQIDLLEQELLSMPNENLNHELEDFVALKEFLINQLNVGNTLNTELTQAQKDFLINARDTYVGRAQYQASNILCFYAGVCEDLDPMNLASIGRSPEGNSNDQENLTVIEDKGNFVLYPNPNDGTFVIKGKRNIEIERLEIQDIQGKVMAFEVTEINDDTVQLDFNSAKRGTYIVRIWSLNGKVQNIRILKN